MAKVILTDNFNREYIEDKLLQENLTEDDAKSVADTYNKNHGSNWDWFARPVADDYRLSRGMADLV